jgi:hypothetical protein
MIHLAIVLFSLLEKIKMMIKDLKKKNMKKLMNKMKILELMI